MTHDLQWDEAVGRLRSRVSSQNFDMWLRPIELMSWDGATLRLRAPNSYIRFWFESNFLTSLVKELQELGHENIRVEFDPDSGIVAAAPEIPLEMPVGSVPTAAPATASVTSAEPVATSAMTEDDAAIAAPDTATLNPRYTFDTFVAG